MSQSLMTQPDWGMAGIDLEQILLFDGTSAFSPEPRIPLLQLAQERKQLSKTHL